MNEIVFTIFLLTIFCVFALYYYHKKENKSNKLFRESISKGIFFTSFIAPLVAASLFSFLISQVFREGSNNVFFKSDVIVLTLLFYLYGVFSASMGIHALAKAFKPQVIRVKDQKLMQLIRFFHGPYSHFASYISFTLILVLLLVFNSNHPSKIMLSNLETAIIIFCGIICGLGIAVIFATGSALRVMRWILLFAFVTASLVENKSEASLFYAPISIFVLTIFITSLFILAINTIGPKRNWFMRMVDNTLVSVDKDWSGILDSL